MVGAAMLVLGTAVSLYFAVQANERALEADSRKQEAEGQKEQARQDLQRLQQANTLIQNGRWFASVEKWAKAEAEFNGAVALRPDLPLAGSGRGDYYARMGLGDWAGADYAQAFQCQHPATPRQWADHLLLRVYLGDLEGYRRAAAAMPAYLTEKQYF